MSAIVIDGKTPDGGNRRALTNGLWDLGGDYGINLGDKLDYIIFHRDIPWNTYLLNCCTGMGTKSLCGQMWNDASSTNAKCDAFMTTYCQDANNKTKDICSCIYAVDANGNTIPQPQCFSSACTTSGYLTSNQKAIKDCGTYCTQAFNLGGNTNTAIDSTRLTQYCGTQTTTTPIPSESTVSGGTSTTSSGAGGTNGTSGTSTTTGSTGSTASSSESSFFSSALDALENDSVTVGSTKISYMYIAITFTVLCLLCLSCSSVIAIMR
jgi:hypothetical protein